MKRDPQARERFRVDSNELRAIMAELGLQTERSLLDYCRDSSKGAEQRAKACYVLGFLRPPGTVPVLIEVANDKSPRLASASISALSVIGSRRATRPLMRIVRQATTEEIRNVAVSCLGRLGDKRAESLVCSLLADSMPDTTRAYAAQALSGLATREQSFKALVNALVDRSPIVRWTAAVSLGNLGDARAAAPLRAATMDDSVVSELPDKETVGEAAKRALDQLGG